MVIIVRNGLGNPSSILDEAVGITHSAITLWKGMHQAMSKWLGRLGSLILVSQPV